METLNSKISGVTKNCPDKEYLRNWMVSREQQA